MVGRLLSYWVPVTFQGLRQTSGGVHQESNLQLECHNADTHFPTGHPNLLHKKLLYPAKFNSKSPWKSTCPLKETLQEIRGPLGSLIKAGY